MIKYYGVPKATKVVFELKIIDPLGYTLFLVPYLCLPI